MSVIVSHGSSHSVGSGVTDNGDIVLSDINLYFVKQDVAHYGGSHRCYGVVADIRCLPFTRGAHVVLAQNALSDIASAALRMRFTRTCCT